MISVQYASLIDAITLIKANGRNCYLAKTDIKSAFRIIPISPDDYKLLGFKWKGKYFYDKVLVMGGSSSCRIFETFSTAIEWVARHKLGIRNRIHILDDFLIVANPKSECLSELNRFLAFCEYCGIPLA